MDRHTMRQTSKHIQKTYCHLMRRTLINNLLRKSHSMLYAEKSLRWKTCSYFQLLTSSWETCRYAEPQCSVVRAWCTLFLRLLLGVVWNGQLLMTYSYSRASLKILYSRREQDTLGGWEESSALQNVWACYSRNKLLQPWIWTLWRFLYLPFKNEWTFILSTCTNMEWGIL